MFCLCSLHPVFTRRDRGVKLPRHPPNGQSRTPVAERISWGREPDLERSDQGSTAAFRTTDSLANSRSVELFGDELSVPGQQRIRLRNGRQFFQGFPSEPLGDLRQCRLVTDRELMRKQNG